MSIQNVPTVEDFQVHGLNFLNLSWDSIFELITTHALATDYNGIDDEQSAEYWQAAQKPLSIAHALAQQGAELILKSIIAEESPFLLIVNFPDRLNKSSETVNYADFKTADSQELIKMCNTISPNRISNGFVTNFNEFRNLRNSLFHSVDKRLHFHMAHIIEYILETSYLIWPNRWIQIREEYLSETPDSAAYGTDYLMNKVLKEVNGMMEVLPPKSLKHFFNFNKKQHSYRCPQCFSKCDRDYIEDIENVKTAQLSPPGPATTNLYCFVCNNNITVSRKKCVDTKCKGNVIDNKQNCLTCGNNQED